MKSLHLGEIFKKIFRRKHITAPIRHPNHDWQRIIIVTVMLLTISFVLNVILFLGVDRGTIFAPKLSAEDTTPSVDKPAINKLSSFYTDREERIKILTASTTAVVDPSL